MLIPAKKRVLFRKYEGTLFYSEDHPRHDRVYGFYLLLRPLLQFLKEQLNSYGLEDDEVESELYLLSDTIFSHFDKDRSSILPYLEKQLPWHISKFLKSIENKHKPLGNLPFFNGETTYNMDEEFYWSVPNILFEEKYVGKCFTRAEKYVIYMIITSSDNDLLVTRLADRCKIDKRRMKTMLSDIGEQL